jgi:hypothetical protein
MLPPLSLSEALGEGRNCCSSPLLRPCIDCISTCVGTRQLAISAATHGAAPESLTISLQSCSFFFLRLCSFFFESKIMQSCSFQLVLSVWRRPMKFGGPLLITFWALMAHNYLRPSLFFLRRPLPSAGIRATPRD